MEHQQVLELIESDDLHQWKSLQRITENGEIRDQEQEFWSDQRLWRGLAQAMRRFWERYDRCSSQSDVVSLGEEAVSHEPDPEPDFAFDSDESDVEDEATAGKAGDFGLVRSQLSKRRRNDRELWWALLEISMTTISKLVDAPELYDCAAAVQSCQSQGALDLIFVNRLIGRFAPRFSAKSPQQYTPAAAATLSAQNQSAGVSHSQLPYGPSLVELDLLRTLVHRIYHRLPATRSKIRQSIQQFLLQFLRAGLHAHGVHELLTISASISSFSCVWDQEICSSFLSEQCAALWIVKFKTHLSSRGACRSSSSASCPSTQCRPCKTNWSPL